MGNIKDKKAMSTPLIIIVSILVVVCLVWTHEFSLPFEFETSVDLGYVYRDEEGKKTDPYGFRWYTVSQKPNTETNESSLRRFLGSDYIFDFDHYTYILVEGCTLEKISFTLPIKVHREYGFLKLPARVELGLDCSPSAINIYRTPKKWLDTPTKDRLNAPAEKIITK